MRRFSRLFFFLLLVALPVQAQALRSSKEYVRRGLTRFGKGDLAGALADYSRAIELDPQMAEAFINRGKARKIRGDLDGAIEDYERALAIDPHLAFNNRDIPQAYTNRGYIRSGRFDLSGAIADFNKAIQLNPSDAEPFLKRGRAMLIAESLDNAIRDFDKSISLDPHNPLAYAERGLARRHQGKYDEAQKDFDKSLQLNGQLKLFIDLHVMDLELQIREMKRRRAASEQLITRTINMLILKAA